MTQKDVAKLLGIQRGTVAVHLSKAREALKGRLGLAVTLPDDGLVASRDRVTDALRTAQQWLAEGFGADLATRDRVRAAVDAVPAPARRWWRRG
jgi:hypothetical protein